MRLIDADALLEDMGAGCIPIVEKGISGVTGDIETIKDYIDMQPTVIEGRVKEASVVCRRTTSVRAIEHHYEEPGEKPYIKYSCPICEALGNLHQVVPRDKNCPLCGVNLYWESVI